MPLRLVKLVRVTSLTSLERADLFRAQWALIVARLELRNRATGSWVRRLADASVDAEPGRNFSSDGGLVPALGIRPSGEAERAQAIDLAVRRAAAFGLVRSTCLLRATALLKLLERDGIHGSRLRVGVRRNVDRFDAHAWVELGALVLGDQPDHVRTFTPTDLQVLSR